MTALHGWHPGEAALQRELGYTDAVAQSWRYVENFLRQQHRAFHTSNLPFIPITTVDEGGRPWASLLAGATGEIGFVSSPDENTLIVNARLWDGDPLLNTVKAWLDQKMRQATFPERFLTAGIGIEYTTRRRNKFAGRIAGVKSTTEHDYELNLRINEAVGNCPKYINSRHFVPYPAANPSIAFRNLHMVPSDKLPDEAIDFIKCADTVFIGSIYKSEAVHTARHPSHAGMNSRGGLPGFVRVMPSDRRTIIVPDYSGNKMLMSLGNIVSSGLAALTFVSFLTGDVLYVTGAGSVLTGPPALKIMARQACVLKLETSGFVFVRDAFPVRQKSGTAAEPSPYSPKIKYLNDEPEALASAGVDHKAKVVSILQLAEDIAVFKFQVIPSPDRKDLMIRPGQAIILDFMDWLGPPAYQHMADDHPQSINDDRVRTWTVSSSHESELPLWFEMTMREMKGGAVTGALFDLVRHHPRRKLGELVQVNSNVVAGVIGVAGDFFIKPGSVKLLFVAGGIGLTPFLSMFDALGNRGGNAQGDIVLALATRDPDVFLQLIEMSLAKVSSKIGIKIDLFTEQERVNIDCLKHLDNCIIHAHKGRIPLEYWPQNEKDRDVFICGPGGFGDAAVEGLKKAGVSFDRIFREGFY